MNRGPVPSRKFDVRGLRRRLGLTQQELAKALGTNDRSIRRWEREGITPLRMFVIKLKELEAEKFDRTLPTAPAVPMGKRRKMPASQAVPTGFIGVLPSSL